MTQTKPFLKELKMIIDKEIDVEECPYCDGHKIDSDGLECSYCQGKGEVAVFQEPEIRLALLKSLERLKKVLMKHEYQKVCKEFGVDEK